MYARKIFYKIETKVPLNVEAASLWVSTILFLKYLLNKLTLWNLLDLEQFSDFIVHSY